MTTNGQDFLVTRDEFEQGMEAQVSNIVDVMNVVNALRRAVNTQAEVLGLHRYILETFVPTPLLEKAAKDYKDAREQAILTDRADQTAANNADPTAN